MKKLLGILGGMGPRASAEFLTTIYNLRFGTEEQTFPGCVLYSDPSIPDRTAAILSGDEAKIVRHLGQVLETLSGLPVEKIVIACVTSHYFIPKLPANIQQKVISLMEIIFDEIMNSRHRHLVLCTNGVRQARLFENDRRWKLAQPWIVFPNQEDQHLIHELIYRLKTDAIDESVLTVFRSFISRYEVESFVVGCTELHGLAMRMKASNGGAPYGVVDPLFSVAKNIELYL